MERDCVFCRILAGEIPATILHRDDKIIALRDIKPQAPTHILIIPREHIPSLTQLGEGQRDLVSHMIYTANELARREGLAERGYRLVINCGRDGGQAVPHLHLHVLGGRQLSGLMG